MKRVCPVCHSTNISESVSLNDVGWCNTCGTLLMLKCLTTKEDK